MDIHAGWLAESAPKTGLDHLGVQAPCINIYGRLLPGITNVTDRARYYSFYPWFFWAVDQVEEPITRAQLQERFRRAECLWALAAERHARKNVGHDGRVDNELHGAAMVGRDSLLPALDRLEASSGLIKLSDHATLEATPQRYFQNPWGGLAQYYRGTLEDLGLIVSDRNLGAKYTQERGAPLAMKMAEDLPGARFFELLVHDEVSVADLDSLADFCPCQLSKCRNEHEALTDLFFNRSQSPTDSENQRQLSLGLLLEVSENFAKHGADLDRDSFVITMYAGSLPDGAEWICPETLRSTSQGWKVYAENELLSLATQSIFFSVLESYQDSYSLNSGTRFETTRDLAAWYCGSSCGKSALASFGDATIGEIVEGLRTNLPDIREINDRAHELQLIKRRKELVASNGSRSELVELGLRAMLSLLARAKHGSSPYGALDIDKDYLSDYPINLASLHYHFENTWKPFNAGQLLAWITHEWCLNTHLSIALRKLRYDPRSTLRIRPTDQGLEVDDKLPEPTETSPRFRQAMQILRDLGLLKRDSTGSSTPTESGKRILEEITRG